MQGSFSLRPARVTDTEALACQLPETAGPLLAGRLRRLARARRELLLVEVRERRGVVGVLHASRLLGLGEAERVRVQVLRVRPDQRRSGVGRRLLQAAESWVAATGGGQMEVELAPGRSLTRAFYELLGYGSDAPHVALRKAVSAPDAALGRARGAAAR
jgi:GNAT superfamily N-acetyltransferase